MSRKEGTVDIRSVLAWIEKYVHSLWHNISKRLPFFDKEGTTNWSEAPAEGIFSVLDYIIEHKPSLSVANMISICRIVKEGPAPGTKSATLLTKRAIDSWPVNKRDRGNFISMKYMNRVTSSTVITEMKRDEINGE